MPDPAAAGDTSAVNNDAKSVSPKLKPVKIKNADKCLHESKRKNQSDI